MFCNNGKSNGSVSSYMNTVFVNGFVVPNYNINEFGKSSRLDMITGDTNNNIVNSDNVSSMDEMFSIAPMMGHTNRHYHSFMKMLMNQNTSNNDGSSSSSGGIHLYTEMIPSATIVRLASQSPEYRKYLSTTTTSHNNNCRLRPEATLELEELLLQSNFNNDEEWLTSLQLGGRDGSVMADAAFIASECFGYKSINVNCGCPSVRVTSGPPSQNKEDDNTRCGGAALMRDATHVASMLQQMSNRLHDKTPTTTTTTTTTTNSAANKNGGVQLSVKHRLGLGDITTYHPPATAEENKKEEEEAYQSALDFAQTVTATGVVSRLQIHSRLALIQPIVTDCDNHDPKDVSSQLWTPGANNNDNDDEKKPTKKIDHSRVQYRAKQLARTATVTNRSAPPLRPNVVERVAQTLSTNNSNNNNNSNVQIITNGGIQNLQQAKQRLENRHISGVMVGRAIINHPCSFTNIHKDLFLSNNNHDHDTVNNDCIIPTRGQVMEQYMEYCIHQEENYKYQLSQFYPHDIGKQQSKLREFSRRLLAVPFTLFTDEQGHDSYQRTVRKLNKKKKGQMSTVGILQAALRNIPVDVLNNQLVTEVSCPNTHSSHKDSNENYIKYAAKRSGPLQRIIY